MASNPVDWTDRASRHARDIGTPAFIFDSRCIRQCLDAALQFSAESASRVLFAMKSAYELSVLRIISEAVSGFAVSSEFEALLAHEVIGNEGEVHFTSPVFPQRAGPLLLDACDYVSFNSLAQFRKFGQQISNQVSCGIRVNPEVSNVADSRYDPCRQHSKLGVNCGRARIALDDDPSLTRILEGFHFHSNCEADDFNQLKENLDRVESGLGKFFGDIAWLNLGGGYIFHDAEDFEEVPASIRQLSKRYGLRIYIEPGASIVRDACVLVTRVADIVESGQKQVAILDTTVNHMPEVFEYQYRPEIHGASCHGPFSYILAGCTCLAGDLFGEYGFDRPLEIGMPLIIERCGAYTMVKAHMFNGVNLPSVYCLTEDGQSLVLCQQFGFDDFARRAGIKI